MDFFGSLKHILSNILSLFCGSFSRNFFWLCILPCRFVFSFFLHYMDDNFRFPVSKKKGLTVFEKVADMLPFSSVYFCLMFYTQ